MFSIDNYPTDWVIDTHGVIVTRPAGRSNNYSGKHFYMESSSDRARALIKLIGPKRASEQGGDYERWRNVSKGAVRVSAEEIDVLVKIYPQYALWIASGNVAPEVGQTSPDYDEANRNLSQPNAG